MAARRPFVATTVGGIPDMAGNRLSLINGVAWHARGVLAQADAASFAAALCRLATDRRLLRTMGEAAHEYACRQNDLESLMRRLDGLYTGLLLQAGIRRQRSLSTAH
jgi:glycosyltransferase involved in cell wall biosynthesis